MMINVDDTVKNNTMASAATAIDLVITGTAHRNSHEWGTANGKLKLTTVIGCYLDLTQGKRN